MKFILLALSALVIASFAQAADVDTVFVYTHPNGVAYTPSPSNTQSAVRVLETSWGYDLSTGDDTEVCIVIVEALRGGDAPINPPADSFLIFDGQDYQQRTTFEAAAHCLHAGV